MGSLDSILVKQGNAQNIAGTIVDDSPVAIRLKYVGTGTVTSVTVTTATNVIMVTSDGGTDTYTFSTYTNMGLLADKINGDGIFECIVLDALRTDETTNSDFITGAKTITSDGYYDMTIDTDTAQNTGNDYIYTYRCSYDRNPGGQKPKGSHRVRLSEVLYNVDVNGVEAKGFQIYEWDAEAKTETVVYQKVSVDATATTVNFASGNQTLDSGVGNDLIVRVKDSTSITDAAGNYLICSYIRE